MSDPALRTRLRANLTDEQSVTVTAIGLALVAFVLVSLDSSPLRSSIDFGAEFLLSLSLMDMAFAYDYYWPVAYRPRHAVLWALLFGVATAGVFTSIYTLGVPHLGTTAVSIAAFVITVSLQFGSAILYARVR